MTVEKFDIVIVGGGQAGAQAAVALRQQGHDGSIAIIGAEPELPYDRPPLSKEYLSGEKSWERVIFRSAEAWKERGVALRLGEEVVAVDPAAHEIETLAGERIVYGQLIWAAGAVARRLTCDGNDVGGVHSVRNRADVDRMIAELPDTQQIVVIGGGYIGLEAAAVLRKFDKHVVLLEAQDRVLARVAGEPLSRFFEAEHRSRGVEVRLGVGVAGIEAKDNRATGVRLSDGSALPAQMVIVGIGVVPVLDPLAAAGAECGNGVRVDELCRTSLRDVYAIGDCAEHRSDWAEGDWIRLESVQNANDQAMTVAKFICGNPERYRALPWFWSNQYDIKLQTIGLSRGHDEVVLRGDPGARAFTVIYLRKGRVIALDCVNSVRDYSHGRLLVQARSEVDPKLLTDVTIQLKQFVS